MGKAAGESEERQKGGNSLTLHGKNLFDLLGLISVNNQGSFSGCHLNYLLCEGGKRQ